MIVERKKAAVVYKRSDYYFTSDGLHFWLDPLYVENEGNITLPIGESAGESKTRKNDLSNERWNNYYLSHGLIKGNKLSVMFMGVTSNYSKYMILLSRSIVYIFSPA